MYRKNIDYPFLSIIIPTRDRPILVEDSLYGLSKQTFSDYEVIVSDNYINDSCEKVVAKYSEVLKGKLRYVVPETNLSISDHWEYACSHATGSYITILMDKYMFYPFAISDIYKLANKNDCPDIINWICEGVVPEESNYSQLHEKATVKYSLNFKRLEKKPTIYDPREELKRRRNNSGHSISKEKELYFRGKIVSGAFKMSMVKKIITKHGRLFPPCSPDYTSLTLGLANAKKCIDSNKVLSQYIRIRGGGYAEKRSRNNLSSFLNEMDGYKYYNFLPIKELYLFGDNWVAWDYYADYPRDKPIDNFVDLDYKKLVNNIKKTMRTYVWDNAEQEYQQKKILSEFIIENKALLTNEKPESSEENKSNGIQRPYVKLKNIIKLFLKEIRIFDEIRDVIIKISRYKATGTRRNIYNMLGEYHDRKKSWAFYSLKQYLRNTFR